MIKPLLIFFVFFFVSIISLLFFGFSGEGQHVQSTGAAPAGHTGSPFDNKTCTVCHAGPLPQTISGAISSNVPITGYMPGSTYQVTATITRAGHSKFGFQASPQNNAGNLLGTLANTSTQTTIIGSGKYITHTNIGTSGPGTKTWSFNWTAPGQGTGNVTFYAAFNVTNSNNANSGDTIFISTLTIPEDLSSGIAYPTGIARIDIFPVPANNFLNVNLEMTTTENTRISAHDLSGKELFRADFNSGSFVNETIDCTSWKPGVYFIRIENQNGVYAKKIAVVH